jgi:hypothetical protein
MRTSIEVILFTGFRLPLWLTCQSRFITDSYIEIQGERLRSLAIKEGEYEFDDENTLYLKTPAMLEGDRPRSTFGASNVLLARQISNLATQRYFDCYQCNESFKQILQERRNISHNAELNIFTCRFCKSQWLVT